MSALPEFPAANDPDALETQEWLDALDAVLQREGPERAHYLLEKLVDKARRSGAYIPFSLNTAYLNTIPVHMEERSPGDHTIEESPGRTSPTTSWAAISRASPRSERSSASGSITSGTPRTRATAGI
jgi:pyruvate dehydrogenase E1 component